MAIAVLLGTEEIMLTVKVWQRAVSKLIYWGQTALVPIAFIVVRIYSEIAHKHPRFAAFDARLTGALARNLDCYLRCVEKAIGYQDVFLLHCGNSTNNTLLSITKKHIRVLSNPFWHLLLGGLARFPNAYKLDIPYDSMYSQQENLAQPISLFSESDEANGRRLLEMMGIDPLASWYVCFFARDFGFNDKNSPQADHNAYRSYHSHRNSDILSQVTAMRFIIEKGGFAIRIGKDVIHKVPFVHERLIDYPFSDFRSDFGDIYLATHCKFFVGDASGLVAVAATQDIPSAIINYYMYDMPVHVSKHSIYIPKIIKDGAGRPLSVRAYAAIRERYGFDSMKQMSNLFSALKLQYESNSEDDILAITKAMYSRCISNAVSDDQWREWTSGAHSVRSIYTNVRVWAPFFRTHPELLGESDILSSKL